jgi:hypothetical protein
VVQPATAQGGKQVGQGFALNHNLRA